MLRSVRSAWCLLLAVMILGVTSLDSTEAAPPKQPKNPAKKPPGKNKGDGAKNKGDGKGQGKGNGKAKQVEDLVLIAELRYTHAVLKAANGIYGGHRAKALRQIDDAIGHLKKSCPHKSHTNSKHIRDVPKVVSHNLLVQTGKNLETILTQLSTLPPNPHRKKAAQHLRTAHTQLLRAVAFASRMP